MRAVVIYESMFGSTKSIAEAICQGLAASSMDTALIRASEARQEDLGDACMLVVGAPTHMRGLPRVPQSTSAGLMAGWFWNRRLTPRRAFASGLPDSKVST
jgi:flavorubredoxin